MFSRYIQQTYSHRQLTPTGDVLLLPTYSIDFGAIARDFKRGVRRRMHQMANWVKDVAVTDFDLQALRIAHAD